jgi:actin-related protein
MTDDLYNLPSKSGGPSVGITSSIVGNVAGAGATDHQTSYFLPDGSQVLLNKEKILAPEILFAPERIGLEYPGIHEMVVSAIKKCDLDLRKQLYNSIITAGGTTLLHGFGDRLHKSI